MKKLFATMGILAVTALTITTAIAESTIYTDGLGRMHFLGKDAASNSARNVNYANPEQQDLTRRLYENSTGELNYVDRPLKNYENTFSDSRYTNWRKKFESNVDDARVNVDNHTKATFSAEKGANDASNPLGYGTTNIDQNLKDKSSVEKNSTEKSNKSSLRWFKKKSK